MKKIFLSTILIALLSFTSCVFASETVKGDVIVVLHNTTGSSIKASNFSSSSAMSAAKAFAQDSNTNLKVTYPSLSEASNMIFMTVHSDTKSEYELLEEFRKRPDVKAVSLNHVSKLMREPNDSEYYRQWGLQAIKAPEVWNLYTGSEDVYVAVIDTGIDADHEDLKDNVARELCINFVGYSRNPNATDTSNFWDVDDHGTHCAGIIAAVGNNALGVSGVNWKAKLIGIRVFPENGSANDDDTTAAIDYVVGLLLRNPNMNIASVNLSLGGYDPYAPDDSRETESAYYLAFKTLSDLNRTVICVAAGNENTEVGAPTLKEEYASSGKREYPKNNYVYPAGYRGIDNMIVVAASEQGNTKVDFSNYSRKYVHVAAPGKDIFSTVRSYVSDDKDFDSYPRNPYENMSGTSMATPYVAGVCGLLKSMFPNATASEIKAAILGGADGNYLRDDGTSMYGLVDIAGAVEFLARSEASRTKPKIAEFVLPEPIVNQAYNFEFKASGTQPIEFSIEGDLPEGMTFVNGVLTGTPTTEAAHSLMIEASNSYGTDSVVFNFNIDAGTAPTIKEDDLPEYYRGVEYELPISLEGSYPIKCEITDSNIPSDFNFKVSDDSGIITFKPTQTGSYSFTLKATNSAGSDSKRLTFNVAEPLPPEIEDKELMNAVIGIKYGISTANDIIELVSEEKEPYETIKITGTLDIRYEIIDGKLPDGLEEKIQTKPYVYGESELRILGTPTKEGTFNFTLLVSNDFGETSRDFTIKVGGGKPEFVDMDYALNMPLNLYSETNPVYAVGTAPMNISVSKGRLPNGTELKQGNSSVMICGTPTETGRFDITLQAVNSEGSDTTDVTVFVAEMAMFLDSVLPEGRKDESYSYTIRTVNNVSGKFSLAVANTLPTGLTLSDSGTISGVPSVSGTFRVPILVTTPNTYAVQIFALNIKEASSAPSGLGSSSGGCNAFSGALFALALAALKFRKH